MRIGKYEFNSYEQAIEKIRGLGFEVDNDGIEYPNHDHTIVHLGNALLKHAEFETIEGIKTEVKPPEFGKYRLDVIWSNLDEHPYGWKTYAIDLNSEGVHTFGVSYLDNKM
tara:strand:+ start:214 stop:546 length:333 start_codon:yes stop_codon:yes gene_type:complete